MSMSCPLTCQTCHSFPAEPPPFNPMNDNRRAAISRHHPEFYSFSLYPDGEANTDGILWTNGEKGSRQFDYFLFSCQIISYKRKAYIRNQRVINKLQESIPRPYPNFSNFSITYGVECLAE